MGGKPCIEKILLNSGTIYSEAALLSSRVEAPGVVEITEEQGYEIIKYLNVAEDCMFKAKTVWLKSQQYDGPLPFSMGGKGYDPA